MTRELEYKFIRTPRFPLQPAKFNGHMVISLSGVLERAAEQCRRSRNNKHLAYPLGMLLGHINRIRESQSDEQALQRLEEFLRLWVKA